MISLRRLYHFYHDRFSGKREYNWSDSKFSLSRVKVRKAETALRNLTSTYIILSSLLNVSSQTFISPLFPTKINEFGEARRNKFTSFAIDSGALLFFLQLLQSRIVLVEENLIKKFFAFDVISRQAFSSLRFTRCRSLMCRERLADRFVRRTYK